ncbi:MAG: WD40-like beta Propeller containing protein [Gemmatimonadetes bacterium]|nr:WD40-like beta Propeller containing protein [Gemmatimonadota bacterium]
MLPHSSRRRCVGRFLVAAVAGLVPAALGAQVVASASPGAAPRQALPVIETGGQHPMPDEWIDRETGHRVRKLVRREGSSSSFYFTNPPFVPRRAASGGLMVFHGATPKGRQLFVIDLASEKIRQLTDRVGGVNGELVAPDRGEAFYQGRDSIFSVNVRTGASRLVIVLPKEMRGSISTVNADATVIGGVTAGPEAAEILQRYPAKADYFTRIFAAHPLYSLWTLDVRTGALETIHQEHTWLGHVQFSPTDPELLMFCHEGPWHLLDRIWTIDIRTREVKKIHTRTVENEIAGHEFFGPDGRTIWYDLQIPKGVTFHLRGVDVATGATRNYRVERSDWGIHFNVSPDQTLFTSDGGDSSQVARTKEGMWINLLRADGDHLVSERLVDMRHHGYRRDEPNVQFTPDSRWIAFRGNFDGDVQVYAVEVAKSR